MARSMHWIVALALGLGLRAAFGATFTVDSTADSVDETPGNGVCADSSGSCTLRAAVMEANALAGSDAIMLPAGSFPLTLFGTGEDLAASGDLDISESVTIVGTGPAMTVIDGQSADRIFHIHAAQAPVVQFTSLSIDEGYAPDGGGGILNQSVLTLDNVQMRGNDAGATRGGGALLSEGNLEVGNSEFAGNSAANYDGGAILVASGSLTVDTSTFSNNSASNGGAIAHRGNGLVIQSSTFRSNQASASSGSGGAIWSNDEVGGANETLQDLIVEENSAAFGAGIFFAGGNISFIRGTVQANTASFTGGGMFFGPDVRGATLTGTEILANVASANPGGGVYADIDDTWPTSRRIAMDRVVIDGNVGCGGGGIFLEFGGLEISNSTIANNRTEGQCDARWEGNGGGIGLLFFSTPVTTQNTLIYANSAQRGGGIYGGKQILTNTTVSGNEAFQGGGLYTSGGSGNPVSIILNHTTIAANSASATGGNLYSAGNRSEIRNSIIADAPSGQNCFGTFTSLDYNIESDGSCGFLGTNDLNGIDPLLEPLADNDGETLTHALSGGSPAIDALSAGCDTLVDQRGKSRPQDGDNDGRSLCDIGAYESDGMPPRIVDLGDINANGTPEIAIILQDQASGVYELFLKDSTEGLGNAGPGLPFAATIPVGAVGAVAVDAVPDLNGDGAREIAVLTVASDDSIQARLYDPRTGGLLRGISYPPAFSPLAMGVIPDIDGGTSAAIAVLGVREDGAVKATVKAADSGNLVSSISFAPNFPPKFLSVVPDITGNGVSELSVLGVDAAGNIRAQLKDAASGVLIHWIQYARAFAPEAMVVIPDAPAGPAIAVLGAHTDGRVSAQVKDALTRSNLTVGRVNFSRTFRFEQFITVGNLNGNNTSELVYLGVDDTGTVRAQIKDPLTKALISQVFFSKSFPPDAIAALPDVNGNLQPELGVLGTNPNNGNVRVQIKDAFSAEQVNSLFVP